MRDVYIVGMVQLRMIVAMGLLASCDDSSPNVADSGATGSKRDAAFVTDRGDSGSNADAALATATPCDSIQCGPAGRCALTIQNEPFCLCAAPNAYYGVECSTECVRSTGVTELAAKTHRVTFHATYDGKPIVPRLDGKKVQLRLGGVENYRSLVPSFELEDGVPKDLLDGVYQVSWRGVDEFGRGLTGPMDYDAAGRLSKYIGYLRVHGDSEFTVDFSRLTHVKGKIEFPGSWSSLNAVLSNSAVSLILAPEAKAGLGPTNFNAVDGTFEVYLPAGTYDLSLRESSMAGPDNGPAVRNAIVIKDGTSQVDVKIRIPAVKATVNVSVDGVPFRCDSNCEMLSLSSNSLTAFPRQVSPGRFEFIVTPGQYSVMFAPQRRRVQFPAGQGIVTLGTITVTGATETSYDLHYLKLAGEVRVDGVPAGQSFDFQFTTVADTYRVDNAPDRTFTAYVLSGYPVKFGLKFENGTKAVYQFEPRVFRDGDDKVTFDLAKVNANVSVALSPPNLKWPETGRAPEPFMLTIAPASRNSNETPSFGFAHMPPLVSAIPAGEYWIGYQFSGFGWFWMEKTTLDPKTPTYSGTMNLADVKGRVTVNGEPLLKTSTVNPNVALVRKGTNQRVEVMTTATGEFQIPVPVGDYYAFIISEGLVSCISVGAPQ